MSVAAEEHQPERRLRMKDLCEASGLNRQAIHFYIKEGLLPPGRKTGRNMAWYTDEHVERLDAIRRLQEERFLPLKAIRAVLDGAEDDDGFTRDQRAWLRDLKGRMASGLSLDGPASARVAVADVSARTGVPLADLEALDGIGVVPIAHDAGGDAVVDEDDVWMIELLAELRAAGFTDEAGFGVADIAFYEEVVSELFEREIAMLRERLTRFDPTRAAGMVERVLPLVHRFITRYHEARIRRFFAAME